MPFVQDFAEAFDQKIQLCAFLALPFAVDQPGMTRRLAQSQERLENVHLRFGEPVAPHAPEQGRAVVVAQLVVEAALNRTQLAPQRLLGARGKLRGDLFLGPAQDERAHRAGERLAPAVVGLTRSRGPRPERRRCPEHARIQEFEQAPELPEVVFDRRPAQRKAVPAREEPGRLRRLARRVLDRLGLVQNHVIERDLGEGCGIATQGSVGGHDEIVTVDLEVGLAPAEPGVVEGAQLRREAPGFVEPVEDDRSRRHDERRARRVTALALARDE